MLTDAILVEAMEEEFVPLLVKNNVAGGKDEALLKRFKEPAWNYQVIRYLDADTKDLIPRKDRIWDKAGTLARMVSALEAAKRPVPAYLREKAALEKAKPARMVFAQHCFWTGEAKLGAVEGVLATEAGWFDGREVTLVLFDPERIGPAALARKAREAACADRIYSADPELRKKVEAVDLPISVFRPREYRKAKASDQKRQIPGTALAGIRMTLFQATKANAFIRTEPKKALGYLTPRQQEQVAGKR